MRFKEKPLFAKVMALMALRKVIPGPAMIGIGSKTSKGKMIMKKTLYFAVSAALALAACAKEEAPVENEPTFQNLNTIYASVPETKTTESAAEFSWTDSEAIAVGGILSESTHFYNYTCSNTSTGAFSGSATDSRKVAVSPSSAASAFTTGGDTFSYSLSMGTEYGSYIPGTTNALMVGEPVESNKYRFNHAAALLKVTYENAPVGTTGLKFTSKNHKITGMKSGIATASGVELTLADFASTGGNDVTITLSSPLDATANLIFYIPIPSGDYTSFEFNVNLTGTDAIASSTAKTVKGTTTIARGDVLSLPVITLAMGVTPITIGKTDKTDEYDTAHSDDFSIPVGKVLHLEFENYGTNTGNNLNWHVAVTNNFDRENAARKKYFVYRADTWVDVGDAPYFLDDNKSRKSANLDSDQDISGEKYWTVFRDKMDGATVTATVEHTAAGSAIVKIKAVSADKKTIWTESYSQRVSGTEDIRAYLTVNKSYLILNKAWFSNSKKTVSSLHVTSPVYIYNDDLTLSTITFMRDLYATYDDGVVAQVDPNLVSSYSPTTISKGTSPQTISVGFNGKNYNVDIPVVTGTGAIGTLTYNGGDGNQALAILPSNGTSIVKKMYVYGSPVSNWNCPSIFLNTTNEFVLNKGVVLRMDWYIGKGDSCTAFTAANADVNKAANLNWDLYKPYMNRAKVTMKVTNSNGAITAQYAIQYACDNTDENHGYFYMNFKNISVSSSDKDSVYYCVMENNCYVVFVNDDTPGWPDVHAL